MSVSFSNLDFITIVVPNFCFIAMIYFCLSVELIDCLGRVLISICRIRHLSDYILQQDLRTQHDISFHQWFSHHRTSNTHLNFLFYWNRDLYCRSLSHFPESTYFQVLYSNMHEFICAGMISRLISPVISSSNDKSLTLVQFSVV